MILASGLLSTYPVVLVELDYLIQRIGNELLRPGGSFEAWRPENADFVRASAYFEVSDGRLKWCDLEGLL